MSKIKLHRNTQHKGIKKIHIYMKSQIQQQQRKNKLCLEREKMTMTQIIIYISRKNTKKKTNK